MPVNLISSAHSSKIPWAGRGSVLPPERKHKELRKQEICGPSEYEDTPETWLQRIYLPTNSRFLLTIKYNIINKTLPDQQAISKSVMFYQNAHSCRFQNIKSAPLRMEESTSWQLGTDGCKGQQEPSDWKSLLSTDWDSVLPQRDSASDASHYLRHLVGMGVNKHQMGKVILGHSNRDKETIPHLFTEVSTL